MSSWKERTMRKGFAKLSAVALGLLLATTVASASEQGRFEKSLNVTGAADLQVFTRSGDVTIRSGPAGTIGIIGHIHVGNRWFSDKKADVEDIERNPPIQQSGNNIRIDYVNHQNISIDYEITAPADTKVRTKSGSGDQTIEGMHAGIDIETGSGNVHARGSAGPVQARAGSGDITIEERSKGDVRLETGSGNIEARGVDGGLRASTGSGNVRVDGTPANSWSVRTGSGDAELRLPQEAAFDLDVSSSSGSVSVNHPVTTTIQGRIEESRKSIRGKVRGGGPEISVHTGSGDVRVD